MIFEDQLLFFFSAIGAFNGFFLSVYFAFFVEEKSRKTYFLSALLLMISVRITKSSFLYFYSGIYEVFIHVGLTACALIGPFLYLYIKENVRPKQHSYTWVFHVLPYLLAMIIICTLYPYKDNRSLWFLQYKWWSFGNILYTQWLIYVVLAGFLLRDTFRKVFKKEEKLSSQEIWLLNIFLAVAIVWLAYRTVRYTSYIVGALSFSFVFYISFLLWLFRRKKLPIFSNQAIKYANKKISQERARSIASQLEQVLEQEEIYRNPALKLPDLADALEVSPHYLSQYLNDNLGQNFTNFINTYRVKAAEKMLLNSPHLTLEAIGKECGFNSNSSFYSAFKKIKGLTPGQYKKELM